MTLRSLYVQDFGAFTSPQVETSGSAKRDAQTVQKLFPSNDFCVTILSFTCHLFVFSSFVFQHKICLVSLALVCLALNTFRQGFGRAKYYTRPSLLFCQPSLAYSNITPTVSRHSRITYRKLIFIKESSLFLLSAVIDLNREVIDHHIIPIRIHISVLHQ